MANITDPVRTEQTYYITSSATPNIFTDIYNNLSITALATDITSMTTGLSGIPVDFQSLTVRIKDNGTARSITWGAKFTSRGGTLPTTTVVGAITTVYLEYNIATLTWGCIQTVVETQESDGVWTTFTPTLSGLFTNANWTTKTGRYIKIGKTVTAQYYLVAGASPVSGTSAPYITLPLPARALLAPGNLMLIGVANSLVAGTLYTWDVGLSDTTTAILRVRGVSATYASQVTVYSTTIPAAWASGNDVTITLTYEVA